MYFGYRIGTTECLTRQLSLSAMEANRIISKNGTKAGVPARPLLCDKSRANPFQLPGGDSGSDALKALHSASH